jgi:hypothetical protein
MPRCPYCGSEDLTPIKSWRFRIYKVTRYRCNKCGGEFNHYVNTTGRGKPEYYIPKPKVPSATSGFDHEAVKGWLVEIGEVLGYYVETEFRIRSDIHRFDVAWLLWKDDEVPIAVFEVVVGGDVDKAVQRLVYAQHKRVKGLFLVVADKGDEERARKVLKETYPWLKVEIWYPDKVKELRDTLSKYKDEIRKLTTLGRQV